MSSLPGPRYQMVERFEEGWNTYEETVRTLRPKSSAFRSDVQLIDSIQDEVRRATVWELEERSGYSKSTIHRITQDELEMTRVVARWVTKLLSDEQKRERERVSCDLLKSCRSEKFFTHHSYWG